MSDDRVRFISFLAADPDTVGALRRLLNAQEPDHPRDEVLPGRVGEIENDKEKTQQQVGG